MPITYFDAPPTVDRPRPVSLRSVVRREGRALIEPLRLASRSFRYWALPRGDGRLTVDIPGWLTGEPSLLPLRTMLRSLGHDARAWGLGRNGSDVEETVDQFEPILEQLVADGDGRPAQIVGWSLGGVIGRETARRRPDLVDRIVTFGTPAQGGPSFTAGAGRFGSDECERIAGLQEEANRDDPLAMPVTAIFTKRDGVVDWRACIDPYATDIRHVEVASSHFGLGVDPDVWRVVAHALAP